LIQIGLRMDET